MDVGAAMRQPGGTGGATSEREEEQYKHRRESLEKRRGMCGGAWPTGYRRRPDAAVIGEGRVQGNQPEEE